MMKTRQEGHTDDPNAENRPDCRIRRAASRLEEADADLAALLGLGGHSAMLRRGPVGGVRACRQSDELQENSRKHERTHSDH